MATYILHRLIIGKVKVDNFFCLNGYIWIFLKYLLSSPLFFHMVNLSKSLNLIEEHRKHNLWTSQKVTEALIYLLDNIYIRFGSKLYRQNVGIPMGINCAPLLLICFYFVMRGTSRSLSQKKNSMA